MSSELLVVKNVREALQPISEKQIQYLLLDRLDQLQYFSTQQKINGDTLNIGDGTKETLKKNFTDFAKEMAKYRATIHPRWLTSVKSWVEKNKTFVERLKVLKEEWEKSRPVLNSELKMTPTQRKDYADVRDGVEIALNEYKTHEGEVRNFLVWLNKTEINNQLMSYPWCDWAALNRHWKDVNGNVVAQTRPYWPSDWNPWSMWFFCVKLKVGCLTGKDNLNAALEQFAFCFRKPLERLQKACNELNTEVSNELFTVGLKKALDKVCKEYAQVDDWYRDWPSANALASTFPGGAYGIWSTVLYRPPGSLIPVFKPNDAFRRTVAFYTSFPSKPTLIYGISSLDLDKRVNLRVSTSATNLQEDSVDLAVGCWDGADAFQASLSWLACMPDDPRFIYGDVTPTLGTPNDKTEVQKNVFDIPFKRAFSSVPNVILFIAGLDVDVGNRGGTTGDEFVVWVEVVPNSVTTKGFKVRLLDEVYAKNWIISLGTKYIAVDVDAPGVACGTVVLEKDKIDQKPETTSFLLPTDVPLPPNKFKAETGKAHFAAISGFITKKSSNVRFFARSDSLVLPNLKTQCGFVGGSGLVKIAYSWFVIDNQVPLPK